MQVEQAAAIEPSTAAQASEARVLECRWTLTQMHEQADLLLTNQQNLQYQATENHRISIARDYLIQDVVTKSDADSTEHCMTT